MADKKIEITVSPETHEVLKAYADSKGVKIPEAAIKAVGTGLSRLAALTKHAAKKAKEAKKEAKASKEPKAAKVVAAKKTAAPKAAVAKTAAPKKTAVKTAAKKAAPVKAAPAEAAPEGEVVEAAPAKPKRDIKSLLKNSATKHGIAKTAEVAQA